LGNIGATAGLSSSVAHSGGSTLLDKPAVALGGFNASLMPLRAIPRMTLGFGGRCGQREAAADTPCRRGYVPKWQGNTSNAPGTEFSERHIRVAAWHDRISCTMSPDQLSAINVTQDA
jgi:hypothetical protein